ncbi:hypothetical protein [Jhaorihella thermophila]|uniref:hypothetical protein n=1 Tax=Jhaorihella thermophila TaxID=488547 RepID=UPI0036D356EA
MAFRAIVAAGLIALPGMASAQWRAVNRSEVFPISKGVFEVVNRSSSRTQDYWCAAGDYAITQLRTAATQRIYVSVPIGASQFRSGKRGVRFSLTPPPEGPAPDSYSLSVKKVGENLTAASARNYCYDDLFLDF